MSISIIRRLLSPVCRVVETSRYGVTAGPVGNRQKVVVNILHIYEGIINRTIFRFFHELVVWLAGWLAWLAGWLVVVRARARAYLK